MRHRGVAVFLDLDPVRPLVLHGIAKMTNGVDAIEGMMGSALVTTEKVKVIQYGTERLD